METPQPLKSTPPPREASAWKAYRQKSKEEEPARLEGAAKFLSGMISLTLTLLLSADKAFLQAVSPYVITVQVLLWLIALFLAFLTLYPMAYRVHDESSESIRQAHEQAVRRKTYLLVGATLFFLLGMILLVILFLQARLA